MQLLALLIILLLPFSAQASENLSAEKLALQKKFAEYSDIAKAGEWPQITDGKLLKPGMEDARVPQLQIT